MLCSYCKKDVEFIDGFCPVCRTPMGTSQLEDLEVTGQQRFEGMFSPESRKLTDTMEQNRPVSGTPPKVKFRPRLRPPMLLLCVFDDDGKGGEWIRVRGDRFVIGRTEGDLVIPHETGMSKRHLELVREAHEGHWTWKLRDLESSNGTFVRINKAKLLHGRVFLIGSGRYQFKGNAQGGMQSQAEPGANILTTQKWQVLSTEDVIPMLVQLTPEGEGKRFLIESDNQWLGTDGRACRFSRSDDLLLDGQHVRIYRTGREQWHIEDTHSENGTWLMIQDVEIKEAIQFQVGEQRFFARIP